MAGSNHYEFKLDGRRRRGPRDGQQAGRPSARNAAQRDRLQEPLGGKIYVFFNVTDVLEMQRLIELRKHFWKQHIMDRQLHFGAQPTRPESGLVPTPERETCWRCCWSCMIRSAAARAASIALPAMAFRISIATARSGRKPPNEMQRPSPWLM